MKKLFLVVVVSILAIIACDFFSEHFPPPDIDIVKLSPLAQGVNEQSSTATIDTIIIVPRNSIDGIVNALFWEFYTPSDNQIGSRSDPLRVHFSIPGLIDTTSLADTSYILNLPIPVKTAVSHMINSSDSIVEVKLFITAEDAYGHEKEDTTWAWFSLYYTSGGAVLTVAANPDSIAVNDSSTVTATLEDLAGNPLPSEVLSFSTDICHLSSTSELTDNNGQANVIFYGDSIGDATVTVTHSVAGSKDVQIIIR